MPSARFMTATHVLTMLGLAERAGAGPVSATEMAFSIDTNPVVIRRLCGALREAGLVGVARGAAGGVSLARPASAITLADVAAATETDGSGIARYAPGSPSRRCHVAPHIAAAVAPRAAEAEAALREQLATVTLESLVDEIRERIEVTR